MPRICSEIREKLSQACFYACDDDDDDIGCKVQNEMIGPGGDRSKLDVSQNQNTYTPKAKVQPDQQEQQQQQQQQ